MAERLVMATPQAYKAYGLACEVPGLGVLTRATGTAAETLRKAGAEVCSVPVEPGAPRTTYALIDCDGGRAALSAWAPASVVVFRPDHKTRQLLERLGCAMVSARPGAARRLENKQFFRRECKLRGLPVVETQAVTWPPDAAERTRLEAALGTDWVIQTARGYAGRRTWVGAARELPAVPDWLTGRQALISPRLKGPTWTVNAVVHAHGVRLGGTMRQITGDPRLASLPLSSCGVAFSPPGSEAIAEELAELARRVGEIGREHGFSGFFGIDAVGGPGELQLIEMNARLTATLTVATLAERAAGQVPLLATHVAACLGRPITDDGSDDITGVEAGGHLVVRDTGRPVENLSPGGYLSGPEGLSRVAGRPGWPASGQVTVWPAGPDAGGPDDDLMRLFFSDPMLDGEGRLTPWVEQVLGAVVGR